MVHYELLQIQKKISIKENVGLRIKITPIFKAGRSPLYIIKERQISQTTNMLKASQHVKNTHNFKVNLH